jgi:AcrR family transcriptional regulator
MRDRIVALEIENAARHHRVAIGGARLDQFLEGGMRSVVGNHREAACLSDGWYHIALAADGAREHVAPAAHHELDRKPCSHPGRFPIHRRVYQRCLQDQRFYAPVLRGGNQRMTRAHRAAPEGKSRAVDILALAHGGDGGGKIGNLFVGMNILTRRTARGPEMPVVEGKSCDAAARHTVSEERQRDIARSGKAVTHHDDWERPGALGQVERAFADVPVAGKTHHDRPHGGPGKRGRENEEKEQGEAMNHDGNDVAAASPGCKLASANRAREEGISLTYLRKSPRQARANAMVDVIVEAAARILSAPGGPRLTTNAIAARAGVSVGSLYQYFPNKQAILRALIARELARAEARRPTVLDDASVPASKRMRAAVDWQLDARHDAPLSRALMREYERIVPAEERQALAQLKAARVRRTIGANDNEEMVAFIVEVCIEAVAKAATERRPEWLSSQVFRAEIARLLGGYLERG